MTFLLRLIRCPLCRRRSVKPDGCCAVCREGLFQPRLEQDALVLGSYQGRLEQAVRAYKFGYATRLSRLFAGALAEALRQQAWPLEVVCDVPLHPRRQRQRGYNQAALLARAVARELELPYRPLLRRTRPTAQQARLERERRFANVAGAFASLPLKGERVLLLDDVITSGATTLECRRCLQRAGAADVRRAAIAGPSARDA